MNPRFSPPPHNITQAVHRFVPSTPFLALAGAGMILGYCAACWFQGDFSPNHTGLARPAMAATADTAVHHDHNGRAYGMWRKCTGSTFSQHPQCGPWQNGGGR